MGIPRKEEGSLNNSSTGNTQFLSSWSVPQWPPLLVSCRSGGGGLFIYFLKATGRRLVQLFWGAGSGEDISPSSTFPPPPQDETIRVWLEKALYLFLSLPLGS